MDFIASDLFLILCFAVGTGLVITEAFIPGFGVAGISGIILEAVAVIFTGRRFGTVPALLALLGVLIVVGTTVFLSYRSAMKGKLSKSPLVLKDTEETAERTAPEAGNPWTGREGVTVTPLRPAGFIEIDGERLNAASSGTFLPKGTAVRVTGVEGDHLMIRPISES